MGITRFVDVKLSFVPLQHLQPHFSANFKWQIIFPPINIFGADKSHTGPVSSRNCVHLLKWLFFFFFFFMWIPGSQHKKKGAAFSHAETHISEGISLDAWIVFIWVCRIKIHPWILSVLWGLCYFQHIEKKKTKKQPDLWLHKFAVPVPLVLCSSAYSTNFISTDLPIDHDVAFDAHPSYRPCKRQSLVNITNWSPSMKYRFSSFIEVWVCSYGRGARCGEGWPFTINLNMTLMLHVSFNCWTWIKFHYYHLCMTSFFI